MSELSETHVTTDFVPTDERYQDAFGELPLQATLNMLDAYQPAGSVPDEQQTRYAMEAVRTELLVSGQASRGSAIDLSQVTDESLQLAATQVWEQASAKITARYRSVGAKVIPIVGHQSA